MPKGIFVGIGEIASPGITIAPTGSFRVTVEVRNPGTQSAEYWLAIRMASQSATANLESPAFTIGAQLTRTIDVDVVPLVVISPIFGGKFPVGVYSISISLKSGKAPAPVIELATKALVGEVTVQEPPPPTPPSPSGEITSVTVSVI